MNKIIHGDCLEKLKELEENSIDSIVTDPPYELGFMGKSWDSTGIANNRDMWAECLRVLKPGGHLLAFSGTRTYHRMASAIEDAGFEVRDMIEWVYGSGFPKSLNIGKSVNQLETNEWSKIGKAIDNIDQKSIIEIWNTNSNNVKIVGTQSLKNQIIAGQDTPSENFVVLNVAQNNNQESSNLLVSFVEQNLSEVPAINTKTNTALLSVEAEIRQLQNNAKSAEQQSQNQNHKYWNIFTAQCDVREWLNENMEVSHKVDEALKTLRGNKKYSNEEITNVLCVVIPNILKLTILNQSKTFQSLDTKSQMECASAISATITEYTAENLILNTVAILKSKAVDKLQGNDREELGYREDFVKRVRKNGVESKDYVLAGGWKADPTQVGKITKGNSEWEGWGTALKPAHEPICMARKPLAEKTVAENVLKYGTGGINIDESRVSTDYYLQGNDLSDIISICQLNHLQSSANNAELKKFQDDTTSVIKKLFSVAENVDMPILEKTLGRLQEDTTRTDIQCYEEMLEDNISTSLNMYTLGRNITEQSRKDLKYIISTVLKMITDWKIYNVSAYQLTEVLLTKAKNEVNTREKSARFPANLIHDNSEEVRECFPNESERFFKSIIYQAKASKSERNRGCEGLEEKHYSHDGRGKEIENPYQRNKSVATNNHPTVKPIALMEYLIKMVTPKGGIVLDPFAGSGSTLVAAKQNGFQYIGIEMTEEYIPIINARLGL